MPTIILFVLIIINLAAFLTYGIDKSRATRQHWRISDRVLLALAVVGGFGALAGMRIFRHKTRQPVFRIAAFAGIVINCAMLVWILW